MTLGSEHPAGSTRLGRALRPATGGTLADGLAHPPLRTLRHAVGSPRKRTLLADIPVLENARRNGAFNGAREAGASNLVASYSRSGLAFGVGSPSCHLRAPIGGHEGEAHLEQPFCGLG